MERIYNKLVRDKIPEIIKNNNEEPIIKMLSKEEYVKELEKKLLEEYNEVLEAKGNDRLEELADVLEIISELAKTENSSLEKIIEISNKKRIKRGGFENKIFLEKVIKN